MTTDYIGDARSTATASPESPVRIPLKPCGCGVLRGECCDCAAFAAEFEELAARPIRWDLRGRVDA